MFLVIVFILEPLGMVTLFVWIGARRASFLSYISEFLTVKLFDSNLACSTFLPTDTKFKGDYLVIGFLDSS